MSKNARYDLAVANLRVAPVSGTGGNLCFADPHSDPPALLIAVGASTPYQGTAQSSGGTPLQHGPGPVVRPQIPGTRIPATRGPRARGPAPAVATRAHEALGGEEQIARDTRITSGTWRGHSFRAPNGAFPLPARTSSTPTRTRGRI